MAVSSEGAPQLYNDAGGFLCLSVGDGHVNGFIHFVGFIKISGFECLYATSSQNDSVVSMCS